MLAIADTPLGTPSLPASRMDRWRVELAAGLLPGAPAVRARLAEAGALVVTTGQQPGLFGGPLYTIHKALSARALARELERRWKRPVIPVFWLAGDDHDFAEAAATAWYAADGSLVTAGLEPRPADAPLRPMSREPVPERVATLIADFAATLAPSPARDATISWLERHWHPGATLGQAFAGGLAELLGPLGVLCFDPTTTAAKRAAAPLVLTAIRKAAELDRLLAAHHEILEREGRSPGVNVGEGATLAFVDGPSGRDRLVIDGDGYRARRSGERFRIEDLERIARDEPERLSPNVLLRPVIESALLPTVAYLAGPGELRYLELAAALYPALGVHRQLPTPRWSGLLIEPRVGRTMEKLGVTIEDLTGPPAELDQRILRGLVPDDFEAAFTDLRGAIDRGYDRIAAIARQIDPTLEKPAGSARVGAANAVGDLEKKLLNAQKRRHGELMGQLERARTAIRPGGEPQERVIGLPALAGRYGFDLLEPLATHIDAWYSRALEGAPVPP